MDRRYLCNNRRLFNYGVDMRLTVFLALFLALKLGHTETNIQNLQFIQDEILDMKVSTIKEAKFFIIDLSARLKLDGYIVEDIDLNEFQKHMIESVRLEISDEDQLQQAEYLINELINSIRIEYVKKTKFPVGVSADGNPYNVQHRDDRELPDRMITGLIEFSAGCLLCFTPFRFIGGPMVIDGVRRMLDSTEEESKRIKEYMYSNRNINELRVGVFKNSRSKNGKHANLTPYMMTPHMGGRF